MTAIPARVAGVRDIVVVCPKPDPTVMLAAREAGIDTLLRLGGAHAVAALAFGTESIARVDKIVGPGNAYVAAAKALVSSRCAIDFFAGPSEILIVSTSGRPAWIAADLLAQAEHDPDARAIFVTPSRRLARSVSAEVQRQMPAEGPAAKAVASERRDHRHTVARRGPGAQRTHGTRACRLRQSPAGETAAACRYGVRRLVQRTGLRRLRNRLEPRPPDVRRRARTGRSDGGRFRARLDRAAVDGCGPAHAGAGSDRARAGRRTRSTRGLDCRPTADPTIMSGEYKKPSAGNDGVRLHLNENGAGCSPNVLAVLRSLSARDAAFYPDYDAAQQAVARTFRVSADHVLLTNGLDEGIWLPPPRRFATGCVRAFLRPSASRRRSTCTRSAPTLSVAD